MHISGLLDLFVMSKYEVAFEPLDQMLCSFNGDYMLFQSRILLYLQLLNGEHGPKTLLGSQARNSSVKEDMARKQDSTLN